MAYILLFNNMENREKASSPMTKAHHITLHGIVIPREWQHDGKVSSVSIADYHEHVYNVANDAMGKQLKAALKKRVIVEGFIKIIDNRETIYVHRIRVDTSDPVVSTRHRIS